MSVDINNLGAGGVRDRQLAEPRETAGERTDATAAKDARVATARPTDVQLSEDALSLARLAEEGEQTTFDSSRVDAIRQAIAEGQYHVDPERLAEKFLSLESELSN